MRKLWRGPYLYLRQRPDREPQWIIRDRDRQIHTGAGELERSLAELRLKDHLDGKGPDARPVIAGRVRRVAIREEGFIYFISCAAEGFPVKIGFATNVEQRLRELQIALPFDVRLLASMSGTRAMERDLHVGFRHLWLRGEWFRRDPELIGHIDHLRSATPKPHLIGTKEDQIWNERRQGVAKNAEHLREPQ